MIHFVNMFIIFCDHFMQSLRLYYTTLVRLIFYTQFDMKIIENLNKAHLFII